MFFANELPKNVIKKVQFLLPFDMTNKKKGGVSILLTPNYESMKTAINHKLMVPKYYNSYYLNRSVMYYINGENSSNTNLNESTSLFTEAFENIIRDDSLQVVYKGFSHETDTISKIISPLYINQMAREYKAKLPSTITVEVNRSLNIPEPTTDTIYVNPSNTYRANVFGKYPNYLKFCALITILKNLNPEMNKNLMYAIAIYDSGIYEDQKDDWKFDNKIKGICNCIDGLVMDKGRKEFVFKIVRGTENSSIFNKLSKYAIPNITVNDLLDLFVGDRYIKESELDIESINKPRFLNELSHIDIGADQYLIFEGANDTKLKTILYKDRIKSSKELSEYYKKVKEDLPDMKYTYLDVARYNEMNLFYDTHYYNDIFIKNSTLQNIKGCETYKDLMYRMIQDPSLIAYKHKTVLVPVYDWIRKENDWLIKNNINPISCIYRDIFNGSLQELKKYEGVLFIFLGTNAYFVSDISELQKKDAPTFLRKIKLLMNKTYKPDETDEDEGKDSPDVITTKVIDDVEKSQNIEINNIKPGKINTSDPNTQNKKELVNKVSKAASTKTSVDDTLDDLEEDPNIKDIIIQLAEEPDNGPKLSGARAARMLKLQNDMLDKELKGQSVKELISYAPEVTSKELEELKKPVKLNVDSINPNWENLSFAKHEEQEAYRLQKDIVSIFTYLSQCEPPLIMIDIKAEDTSTMNDVIDTYTVKYEDDNGDRYTVKVDIPKFIDNKYLKLRGNRKELPYQLFLMPVIKTDQDTVQIVTCYNKIFLYRFGSTVGRSYPTCSKLIKVLDKNTYQGLEIATGNNRNVCNKYEVPIDYMDMASVYTTIKNSKYTLYFNQDQLRKKYEVDDTKGVPMGIDNKTKEVIYYNTKKDAGTYCDNVVSYIFGGLKPEVGRQFMDDFESATRSTKYNYTRASILNNKIPLVVICGYYEGLEATLKKAGIKYTLHQKRPKVSQFTDVIRFKDGYLEYELDYASSLLMNGLRDCPVTETSIYDINKRTTYLQYLDYFGGRVISDGLDNYYQLLLDPITRRALDHYKLPRDVVSILLYGNQLLADNKYIKHGDISSTRRIRRQEIIANNLYKVIADEYGNYAISRKHGRGKGFNVKQSAVIDEFMKMNIASDQSIINPLYEFESYNLVTPRGPSGLNSDRAYTLDKRSFDDSMLDVLSMSTGQAGTVGVIRQTTIDANVDEEGYIKSTKNRKNEIDPVNTLCMTEALTPMGTTHDDPMRVAMNYTQTTKHSMRCKYGDPLLISNGADEALPYMISDTFVFKSKKKGTVKEKNEKYIILEYDDGTHDYVDLQNKMYKNSSSGFYIDIKLDTDLKVGSKFKANEIVAYDKLAFSDKVGHNGNIAYDIGCLAKVAILNSGEGYEDSAIVSNRISEKMASEVVLQKPVSLSKDTEIYKIATKGQALQEGDTLCVIQNATEDEEFNALIKNISGDPDQISELGRRSITSKVTGILQDIVIYRTVDKEELSPSLRKVVNAYEKEINDTKKVMKQYGIDTNQLPSTEKLPMTGKLKNVEGVLIEFYLKYEDKFKLGDKCVFYSALKGVTKDIFPEGLEPRSEYRPDEIIDAYLATGSINARMATSIILNGCINKILIELSRQCKDILGIEYDINL